MTDVLLGIKRIERELTLLETDAEPPADWEARVLEQIGAERIERELTRLGTEADLPANWEARVLAATGGERIEHAMTELPVEAAPSADATRRAQREPPDRRSRSDATPPAQPTRPWWHFALPAFAIAGALIVYCSLPRALVLDVQVVQVQPVTLAPLNTASTDVGNRVHVTVDRGDSYRAIWIYRDDDVLVAVCPREPQCRNVGSAMEVDVVLKTIAVYRIVALTSETPIPPPQGHYGDDLAAARRAGATSKTHLITAR